MDLSVVIPVYHSEQTVVLLVRRLMTVLEDMGIAYEIILVDDGSTDQSWKSLEDVQTAYPDRVAVIQLMRNYGQHNALMCGFRYSRGDLVVTLDDDLQNPPEEIPTLYRAIIDGGYDLVYGSYEVKKHSRFRNLGSTMINCFYRCVFRTSVTVSSFRIIRRPLLESIFSYSLNFTFIDGLLAWNTQRIGEVVVAHQPRQQGRSHYSLAKLVVLALNLFTNFSLLPLQFISLLGILTAALGFAAAFYYLCQYFLSYIEVPGYASIIIAILVFGGLQLMALGVVGEYLGRLHLNVNRKPQYVVRQMTDQRRNEYTGSSLLEKPWHGERRNRDECSAGLPDGGQTPRCGI